MLYKVSHLKPYQVKNAFQKKLKMNRPKLGRKQQTRKQNERLFEK